MTMHPAFYLRGPFANQWLRISNWEAAAILIRMEDDPGRLSGFAIIARLEPIGAVTADAQSKPHLSDRD